MKSYTTQIYTSRPCTQKENYACCHDVKLRYSDGTIEVHHSVPLHLIQNTYQYAEKPVPDWLTRHMIEINQRLN